MKNKPEGTIKKIQYIWDYYKLPIAIAAILLYFVFYCIYRNVTRKDTILFVGAVNVATGQTLTSQLTDEYLVWRNTIPGTDSALNSTGKGSRKEQVLYYTGWYLTDDTSSPDYTYTHASQVKILAAINAQQLDIVLMNKDAFDAFAQNGYLADLSTLLAPAAEENAEACTFLEGLLVDNMAILEDNAKEIVLDPGLEYTSVTKTYPCGLDLSGTAMFGPDVFQDTVYLGVISNTPRPEECLRYLIYLSSKA